MKRACLSLMISASPCVILNKNHLLIILEAMFAYFISDFIIIRSFSLLNRSLLFLMGFKENVITMYLEPLDARTSIILYMYICLYKE